MASCRNKEDIAEKSRIDPAQTVGRPHSSIEGLAEEFISRVSPYRQTVLGRPALLARLAWSYVLQ